MVTLQLIGGSLESNWLLHRCDILEESLTLRSAEASFHFDLLASFSSWIAVVRRKFGRGCWASWLIAALLTGSCKSKRPEEPTSTPATVIASVAPAAPIPSAAPEPEPTQLLALEESGYGTTLVADEEAFYLLTARAAYRLVPGQEPLKMPLDLGIGPAVMRDSIVFWSEGAIFRASKKSGKARRVIALPHQPQNFVASGEHFAWLDHADDGRFTIQALNAGKARVIFTTSNQVDAIAMLGERIFFVERSPDGTWRIGALAETGGEVSYSAVHEGRTPAMLAVERAVHYYDGNSYELRRLSLDARSEEVLVKGIICSPSSVWEQVYCGSVEGPFEISQASPTPRPLAARGGRMITAIAAGPTRVAWVRDAGENALVVEMVPRPGAKR
ncbi:MAG: hypothetical protein ACOY0T_16685 [Myxococcota bacterium]